MTSSGLSPDGVEDESNNGEHGWFSWWYVVALVVVLVVVAGVGIAVSSGGKFTEVEFG